MRALLAIASRELTLRWMLVPAALALGFVPIVAPALGFKLPDPGTVGLALSLLFGAMTALITGFTAIGTELSTRRLGFFFSRPAPWWAIWGGKLCAAVLLTVATGLLAAVPWMATGKGVRSTLGSLWDLEGALFAGCLVVSVWGLAHAASVAYASRSHWLAADLGLFAAWLWALWSARSVVQVGLFSLLGYGATNVLLWLPLALVVLTASAVQVWIGRSDARRGHLALSLTLWGLLFAQLLACIGLGWSIVHAPPGAINTTIWAAGAPRGDWIWVAGQIRPGWTRGDMAYFARFLFRTETGAYVGVGGAWATTTPAFSNDGRRSAFLGVADAADREWSSASLYWVDLTAPAPAPTRVALGVPPLPHGEPTLTFCPDGERVLVNQPGALTLYSATTGRHIWTALARGADWLQPVVFLGPHRLRGFRLRDPLADKPALIEIVTVHLADGSAEVTGGIEGRGRFWPRPSASGDRLLTLGVGMRSGVILHEGATGAKIASLAEEATSVDADFLLDGRIALAEVRDGAARLRLFRADGTIEREMALGPARMALLGGEPGPGRISLGFRHALGQPNDVALVDLETGALLREPGLFPATAGVAHVAVPWPPRPVPASTAATLFVGEGGQLVRLDPRTGKRTVLLGRDAARR